MGKQINKPKLRFPEFKGGWEKKKLGEDCDVLMCKRIFAEETTENGEIPFYKIGTLGNLPDAFISRKLFEEYKYKYNYPKKGEILITCSGTVGKCIPFNGKDSYYQDSNIIWIDNPSLKINNEFLYYLVYKISWGKLNSTTITRIYGSDLRGINLIYPKDIPEQQKIASFLTVVDKKITRLKQKKELLEQYKKGVMQKIFSQKLRFKIKNDAGKLVQPPKWEKKKLGEVCDVRRGASPRPISNPKWFDENSKIGWVRISDVTNSNKYLQKTEQYLSNEGISKSRLVHRGSMIMSICATIGKPIYTNFDVCVHDGFVVFENLTLNKEYLFYYLYFIQLNWYKYGQPGTQVNLNSEIVNNEFVPVPCYNEQTKIANFLSTLDEKINYCQAQIEKSQQWKKGLLQKMFV